MINFEPKSKHFLIAITEQTEGGIILPESAKHLIESFEKEPQQILCAAKDSEYKTTEYVMLEPHQLATVTINDTKYFLIPDYRVYGKVLNYTPKPKQDKKTKSKIILND